MQPTLVSFLTRTSVLDQMSGPLCDALMGRAGSAHLLESLERSNMLVIPLDRQRRWYRYHHLFRELLRAELERREPALAQELTLRAADWCEANGLPEAAVDYAMAVGDAGRAARLVADLTLPVYYGGRVVTLQRWFDWFDDNDLVKRYPAVAVLGACVHALLGHPVAAERWADAAEHGSSGSLPDGSGPLEGWLGLLGAALCRHGVERMRTDAEVALALAPGDSPLRATLLMLLGVSHLLSSDPWAADDVLAKAVAVAQGTGATDTAVVALAERSILAIGRREWSEAELLVERARSIARRAWLEEYVTTALPYAVAAQVAIHRGEPARAQQDLAQTQRLRPKLTYARSFLAVQARLELARPTSRSPTSPPPGRCSGRPTRCCGGGPTSASWGGRPTSSGPTSTPPAQRPSGRPRSPPRSCGSSAFWGRITRSGESATSSTCRGTR
jgi:LuxR family transcriptional regulator, maltose regulon positive regulatory protein